MGGNDRSAGNCFTENLIVRRIMSRGLLIIAAVVVYIPVALFLFWVVHRTLDRVCVKHAQRFCGRRSLEISRVRWQPDFAVSGRKRLKTEFTQVQLDCVDTQKQRRLVLILVWP